MKVTAHETPTTVSALRIRFVSEAPSNAEVFARFSDPRSTLAVGESVAVDRNSVAPLATGDGFDIIRFDDDTAARQMWSTQPLLIKGDWGGIRWQSGRATITATERECKSLLPGLIEFAFYESELRKLEQAVIPYEASADADVSLAYKMTGENRQHWDRLYRSMEQLYRLRLQFARLEPHLEAPSFSMPSESQRLFTRLVAKSNVAHRLESLSNRLETCEDLYEGACDRITDFKAYRKGNYLEIAIVILLALEVGCCWFRRIGGDRTCVKFISLITGSDSV